MLDCGIRPHSTEFTRLEERGRHAFMLAYTIRSYQSEPQWGWNFLLAWSANFIRVDEVIYMHSRKACGFLNPLFVWQITYETFFPYLVISLDFEVVVKGEGLLIDISVSWEGRKNQDE